MTLSRGERFEDARRALAEGENTISAVSAKTGVSASLIQALEDDGNSRDVGYSKVAALAKHYGTSSDYLLGLSGDVKSPDIDVQAICKRTGLSEPAIDKIINMNAGPMDNRSTREMLDGMREILNQLLMNGFSDLLLDLQWLIRELREMDCRDKNSDEEEIFVNAVMVRNKSLFQIPGTANLSKEDYVDFKVMQIERCFGSLLRSIIQSTRTEDGDSNV